MEEGSFGLNPQQLIMNPKDKIRPQHTNTHAKKFHPLIGSYKSQLGENKGNYNKILTETYLSLPLKKKKKKKKPLNSHSFA